MSMVTGRCKPLDLGATLNPEMCPGVFVTFLMTSSSNKVMSPGTRAWDSTIPFGEACFNSQLCPMLELVWLFGYLTDAGRDRQPGLSAEEKLTLLRFRFLTLV